MIVDLSHTIRDGMQTFPADWHPRVCIQALGRLSVEGRRSSRITLGTHTGTHLDAPSHFLPDGATVDEVPLNLLMGPCQSVDMSGVPASSAISPGMLEEAFQGRDVGPRVVLSFGWSVRFNTESFYRDSPYLTDQAAEWLVANGVQVLGYDVPSPDNPLDNRYSSCDSPIHKILLGAQVWLLESLNSLDLLPQEFELIALPLPVAGLDGAPVRCLAVVNDQ